jgi:hypothetical protein
MRHVSRPRGVWRRVQASGECKQLEMSPNEFRQMEWTLNNCRWAEGSVFEGSHIIKSRNHAHGIAHILRQCNSGSIEECLTNNLVANKTTSSGNAVVAWKELNVVMMLSKWVNEQQDWSNRTLEQWTYLGSRLVDYSTTLWKVCT